jgi:hypothetical protein
MPTFDDLFAYISNTDPTTLLIIAIVAVIVVFVLFRFAAGLVMRILSIGCVVIVIAGLVWLAIQFLF